MPSVKSKLLFFIILFIFIYIILLSLIFFINPLWKLMEKISFYIDGILSSTGIAMVDGELDPAWFWVIFGIPLLAAFIITYCIKRFVKLHR